MRWTTKMVNHLEQKLNEIGSKFYFCRLINGYILAHEGSIRDTTKKRTSQYEEEIKAISLTR